MLMRREVRAALEAMLFAAGRPLTVEELAQAVDMAAPDVRALLDELVLEYNEKGSGLLVAASGQGYLMCTSPEYAPYVKKILGPGEKRLSQAALETLAVVAYRQPVTRAEIEAVRGVRVDRTLASLLARGLVAEVGRKEVPGRPALYGTTVEFLRVFGMTSLDELPPADKED
ncbi:MAG: SMC-Scp complex subunit ScpB [Syntrophomonadaceae bacterium]|jgi:segregation and condensation protein B|nr:SMC-Scp complex subunit ScpB [Syntrophomonadaceae bacterium]MDH7498270.1 SMC-Scp complex subunit ScpB [Syntrophomonadaceae bacterium]